MQLDGPSHGNSVEFSEIKAKTENRTGQALGATGSYTKLREQALASNLHSGGFRYSFRLAFLNVQAIRFSNHMKAASLHVRA